MSAVDVEQGLQRLELLEQERTEIETNLEQLDAEFDRLEERRRGLVEARDRADRDYTELFAALDDVAQEDDGEVMELVADEILGVDDGMDEDADDDADVAAVGAIPVAIAPAVTQQADLSLSQAFEPPTLAAAAPSPTIPEAGAEPSWGVTAKPWHKRWQVMAGAGAGLVAMVLLIAFAWPSDDAAPGAAEPETPATASPNPVAAAALVAAVDEAPVAAATAKTAPARKRTKRRHAKRKKKKSKAKPKAKSKAKSRKRKR